MVCLCQSPSVRRTTRRRTRSLVLFTTIHLFLTIPNGTSFSMTHNTPVSSSSSSTYSQDVYWDQYTEGQRIDQGAYGSLKFWAEVDASLPSGWHTSESYRRFRGFCDNLKRGEPGKEVTRPNGQVLLEQYLYPGLDHDDDDDDHDGRVRGRGRTEPKVVRAAYPAEHYRGLRQLQEALHTKVQPVARTELEALLTDVPLVDDDATFAVSDDGRETWQRAAWYGWQYLNLRGAKRNMPQTGNALVKAMGGLGPAHRFVGLSRQAANCTGTVHSDGRNYMLSTLTPVLLPKQHCGIVVDGIDAPIDERPVILDNTFPHHIYNTHPTQDRFCVMAECYHPALRKEEREAIATLFAVKDRFTVQELQLAPWGYDDDELELAITTGAIQDLDYWRHVTYSLSLHPTTQQRKRKRKHKTTKRGTKGFGK